MNHEYDKLVKALRGYEDDCVPGCNFDIDGNCEAPGGCIFAYRIKGESLEHDAADAIVDLSGKLMRVIGIYGQKSDVVTELLARIGEQMLLWDGCSAGLLPKDEYANFAGVRMWQDKGRQLVVELSFEPRRLVLDEILGWQWYNSEGPEE